MTKENIFLVVLIMSIIGVWPRWTYSQAWGYDPARYLTLVLMIFLLWDLSEGRFLSGLAGEDFKGAAYHLEKFHKATGPFAADRNDDR